MSKEKYFLVISADRRVRASKRPQVQPDEVAILLNITFPDSWGAVIGSVDITVPDFVGEVEVSP